jgi:Family with sequence similarity 184, A and B
MQSQLSKKVAQLTKVICHLNNRHEDPDADMQELADAYEKEVEQMLNDASQQINSFKKRLDMEYDDREFKHAVHRLQAEHEQQRQVCSNCARSTAMYAASATTRP